MGLTTADHTKIRLPHHTWTGDRLLTVNAVPLTIAATAQINQSSFSYPIVQLTVDNTSADWLTEAQVGRMFMVGTAPGLYDVTVGVIRKATTATTLYIDPKYNGEPGWPRDIQKILANDYYVSIVKFRPPWGNGSIIRKGTFYKFWDTTYSDQGRKPFDLVNLGMHQQADVDSATGKARFTVDVSRTFWGDQSYSAHTWNVDGQTVVSSDLDQLVVDCEPGCHEISYELTNNQGKVTTAYRYLFANDDTTYPPLNASYDLSIDCQQDRQGCSFDVTVHNALETDTIYPGQLWLMTTAPRWGNPATGTYYTPDDLSDPDAVATNFVGYINEGGIRTARDARETLLRLESPVRIARQVPVEKQIIIEKKTPGNWAEVTKTLSNPVGMFYYLSMLHAPYLINGHDVNFESILLFLRRKAINLDSDVTLGGQLEQLSRFLDGEGNIGSDASGATWMYRHPAYMASTTRNALDDRWAWEVGDIDGELEKPLRFRPQVGKTYAGAFAHRGASESLAWRALAPGYVRSQAGGETSMDDTTVTVSGGQTRVNQIAGFHHARQNLKSGPFQFTVNGIIDVADPARLDEWHTFTVAASYDPLGEGWTAARFLPLTVNRRWSGPGGRRYEITIEAEPESFGYPGITLPMNPGAGSMWATRPVQKYFDPYFDKIPADLAVDLGVIGAWNDYLLLGRSFNFGAPQTTWERSQTFVVHMEPNWHSDYFTVGAGNPLEVLVLTWDADAEDLTLYSVPDYFATTPTFNSVESWNPGPDTQFAGYAHILVDPQEADYWVVVFKNDDGMNFDYSTNGGTTWAGPTTVGSSTPDSTDHDTNIVVALYNQRLIIADRDGTTDGDGDYVYYIYTASTKGGAFTKLSNPTDYSVHLGAAALMSTTSAVVPLRKKAAPEPDNALSIVDFDGSTYPDYTISGGVTSDGEASSAFFPAQNDMAFGSTAGPGGSETAYCNVTVDLTAYYTISQIDFWTNKLEGWNLINKSSEVVVTLLDDNDEIIASHAITDDSDFITGAQSVTADDLGLNGDEQTYKVKVSVTLYWTDNGGGPGNTIVFIDDIDITATLIAYETDRAIFSLNPSTGTYTERNSFQLVPFHHFGIAVDRSTGSTLSAIVRDEDGNQPYLIQSTNSGQNWSRVRRVEGMVGCKRSADVLLMFGYNRLDASDDAGVTSYNMLGDWAGRVGPVGRIKGVAGVL